MNAACNFTDFLIVRIAYENVYIAESFIQIFEFRIRFKEFPFGFQSIQLRNCPKVTNSNLTTYFYHIKTPLK